MGLRITTWNDFKTGRLMYSAQKSILVSAVARIKDAMFDTLEADVVVMQETKIQRKDLQDDMVLVPGWDVYFSLPRHKKGTPSVPPVPQQKVSVVDLVFFFFLLCNSSGYSGVAIYTRNASCAPIRAEEGITGVLCRPKSETQYRHLAEEQQIGGYPLAGQLSGKVDELELDSEGRCVILEFPAFVLVGVYSPASRQDDARNDFRLGFLEALDVRVRNLVAAGKQVVLTGDLNVIRNEKDTTNLMETLRKEDMTLQDWLSMPSRRLLNQLLFEGSVVGKRDEGREQPVLWDLCRSFHPNREGMNTCWETKRNMRPSNNGSRIDYVLCSDGLKSWFADANIQEGLMGSDHCPVFATVADRVHIGGEEHWAADLMNPPGMFQGGRRVREWSAKDVLPLSAKLIPEFDRRQSIRDMFSKVPSSSQPRRQLQESALSNAGEDVADPPRSPTTASLTGGGGVVVVVGSCSESDVSAPNRQPLKRPLAEAPGKGTKRTKPSNDNKAGSGQKTLQGFFKPKATAKTSEEGRRRDDEETAQEEAQASERVFDPVQAKESWSKLLGKRQLPRCEHNEPCISLVTKKPGVNCGIVDRFISVLARSDHLVRRRRVQSGDAVPLSGVATGAALLLCSISSLYGGELHFVSYLSILFLKGTRQLFSIDPDN
ncbi:hypothetical protein L249_8230 [Ophiocordyceps polyrhachis-furcata BCC 54312]|uniref:Endonuclease/exonuclease/phosphatase domain-containing protein n=1 Tax=Ophiocordyceps polyrhachis-furcata BCC 54312 TaxID=1330021 RepID=A0A367LH52_9HYPO|nr:hypothetical protein L249_8230 [Ophiocordyceps polyrhachis-furcata BCC 54312]